MTCVHKVRWSVKRPEDCRFRLSVSHYKDRIVAPDEYSGATVVTPSDSEQVLATTDKLVKEDITVNPAPTEILSTDHNGTFTPSSGKVGFYQVDVDVQPDLRPLSVSENGTYQPDGFDGYSQVSVDVYPTGYSDDLDDFSGGNVLALISHTAEYINTEYLPKACIEYFLKATKSVKRTSYENLFAALFYSIDGRVGIQMSVESLTNVNIYATPSMAIVNLPTSLSADVPTVLSARLATLSNPFTLATKPLLIFYGYYKNTFDRLSSYNFYGLKCYEFGTLVKKYVPWLDENNVPCVKELISGDLLYNSGTGTFGYIDLEGNTHDA